jgi:hypothetical protein
MLEMRRGSGSRHFQMSIPISMDMKPGSAVGHREWQSNGWEGAPPNQKQTSAPALLSQVMYYYNAGAGEREAQAT